METKHRKTKTGAIVDSSTNKDSESGFWAWVLPGRFRASFQLQSLSRLQENLLNGLTELASARGFVVNEVAAAARKEWESKVLAHRVPIAVSDLTLWQDAISGVRSTLCTIHDIQNRLSGSFAIHHWPIRTLPGHRILRLENFGESIPAGAEESAIQAVVVLAKRLRRILRVDVELLDRDHNRRSRIAGELNRADFRSLKNVRNYSETSIIELQKSDESLLSSFSSNARYQIRKSRRYPIRVVSIEDDSLIPQLESLRLETYSRTGGRAPALNWAPLLAAAREAPERIRIFGAMYGEDEVSSRLVAYAVVYRNGTFVQYNSAGSTRLPDGQIPLMYPVIWELLRWSRNGGSAWFDFGGITDGSSNSRDDAVGGISEFKRYFGGQQELIGENWRMTLAPRRQFLVRLTSKIISVLR